ncbi:MAG TPA: FIST N-terminal domain-containing protein [Burkholderiales bacterium]|nr:FIST N-terminal domain-containing protein [Burkholderiales bacterium]
MSAFRLAHASGIGWRDCVDACAAQLGRGDGLGFAYFTDALVPDAARIVDALRERTGVRDWVGTVGIGVLATGVEYVDEPALVAMVADLEPGRYTVFSGKARLPQFAARAAGDPAAADFAVVHADPHAPEVQELIADMSGKVASGYLVGGLSSSRTATVQIANEVLSGGLSGVALTSEVRVSTRLTQGCSPLAGRHRVTECDENVIAAFDGRPALDVFRESVGEVLARDLRRAVQTIHVGLPVVGSDTGDYKVRNVIGLDMRNKLIAIGEAVEAGDEILFCKRDGASAREDLRRMLGELKSAGAHAARGALYFSCVARGEHMFGRRGAELELVREALGDLPLVGFFCSGEISHDRLYGYTGVLTLFF